MASRTTSLTAKFKLIDEMSSRLDKIADSGHGALSAWEKAGQSIDTAFVDAVQSTDKASSAIDTSIESIESLSNASERLSETENRVKDDLDEVANSTEKATKETEKYSKETENSSEKSEEFGKSAAEAIEAVEQVLVTAGITEIIKEIGNAFIECVEDAIEFESAITGVYKTVDGTDEQLAAIKQEVKDLSLEIPSTTTEISAVAEAAGQLGIATEDVMTFSEVMINLGEATNLSSDEAASSLAKFSNITGMTASNYENLGSTVVALGNNFATTEADIVAMSTRMASAGTLAGMTEPDILALSASLSSVGVEADAGGSAMSTLIANMQLAVETGGPALEQFASVAGHTADEFKTKFGEDAANALYLFIDGLNDTERNGKSATAVLDEMGITEIRLSNAVKSLANNSDNLGDALTFSASAWEENTALANEASTRYATLESRLAMTKNAATNLTTAIGDALTPTVGNAADIGKEALEALTDFVTEHPNVVKSVTAVTITLGTFVVGVTAYTAAVKVAEVATVAFDAAFGKTKIGLIITGVVALTAGIAALVTMLNDTEKETLSMTSTTQKQYYELQNLNAEYEVACEKYGETSEEASKLRYELDALNSEYESSYQTMEDYAAECQANAEAHRALFEEMESNVKVIEEEELKGLALVSKLEDLASQTDITATSQKAMEVIIEELNGKFDGLNLSYEDIVKNQKAVIESTRDYIRQQAEIELQEERYKQYSDLIKQQIVEEEALEKAKIAVADSTERERKANEALKHDMDNGAGSIFSSNAKEAFAASKAARQAQDAQTEAQAAFDETSQAIKKLEQEYNFFADEVTVSGSTSTEVINSMGTSVLNLAAAYNDAYEAAKESFEGQFSLFDQAKVDADATVANAQKALDSQLKYWQSYGDNIDIIKSKSYEDLHIAKSDYDALMAYVQDGSAEAAGLAQSMAKAIKSGNTEAVAKLANTIGKVEDAQKTAAEKVAVWQTDIEEKLKNVVKTATSCVNKMELTDEARSAAMKTIDSYSEAIKAGGSKAIANAKSVASQVKAALGDTTPQSATEGYATGTSYATAGWKLVGENGPEIVEFRGGEKVYTAEETQKVFAESAANKMFAQPTSITHSGSSVNSDTPRNINIQINGSGAISVDKSMDEESVVAIMQEHLKPVLIGIVKQEVFEEGDNSYDY